MASERFPHPHQRFYSKAPTRIDLAGGTIDLWPLYLLLENASTVNLGIDLFAEATLEVADQGSTVYFKTEDQGEELAFSWSELETHNPTPALELLVKLVRYTVAQKKQNGSWNPSASIRLTTRARSPAGAGLGGSSTLCIAILGALQSWKDNKAATTRSLEQGHVWVAIARDTEATVIRVPPGQQDYYGAYFGGLQQLHWKPVVASRDEFSTAMTQLFEDRLILLYSGKSRNSGINNWALFKSLIDGDPQVRARFQEISDATQALASAIRTQNWEAVCEAIRREWQARRTLASGITTPEIDATFETASKFNINCGKICGAGGGGCFFLAMPSSDPELKLKVVAEVEKLGVKHLPFRAVPSGVQVN